MFAVFSYVFSYNLRAAAAKFAEQLFVVSTSKVHFPRGINFI